jgi:hypothetical protein
MTTKERYNLLVKWQEQYEVCEKANGLLDQLLRDFETDSPLGAAIWTTFDQYTDTLAAMIGDDGSWLSWFCWDNGMGKKGHKAKAASWKRLRKINNIKDLCKIIEADI